MTSLTTPADKNRPVMAVLITEIVFMKFSQRVGTCLTIVSLFKRDQNASACENKIKCHHRRSRSEWDRNSHIIS